VEALISTCIPLAGMVSESISGEVAASLPPPNFVQQVLENASQTLPRIVPFTDRRARTALWRSRQRKRRREYLEEVGREECSV